MEKSDGRNVAEVLRAARPYLDRALEVLPKCEDMPDCDPIEVPADVLRDTVAMLAAHASLVECTFGAEDAILLSGARATSKPGITCTVDGDTALRALGA